MPTRLPIPHLSMYVSPRNGNEMLTFEFDDVSSQSGFADIPSPYHALSFSSFSIFKPTDPALKGLISDHDLNCATSSPNALYGSRPTENADGPSFWIANATAMHGQGLQPFFTLKSFYVKPLDAPNPGTTISVKGFSKKRVDPLKWHVEFPSGYHLPFLFKVQEYSGRLWDEMHRIEVAADFGYDSLDWEFCIDDLQLEFQSLSTNDKTIATQFPPSSNDVDSSRARQAVFMDSGGFYDETQKYGQL